MTITALIFAAFIIGFLLGDRRAVREMNGMIAEHNDKLERFLMEQALSDPEPSQSEQGEGLTLH